MAINAVVLKNGMPYGPDVVRLKEAFPQSSLTEGRVIPHAELEKVVQQSKGSGRYYGVVDSWITHHLNETGVFMVWEMAQGIKVLSPAEILEYAEKRTRQKIRQTGRAIKTFGYVDRARLDETGQRRLDHQMRVANALKESIDSARKQLTVDLAPVKSLPKPSIVRTA